LSLDLLIILGVVIGIGVPLWGIVDAARRPPESFHRIGSDKTRWIVLMVVLTVFLNLAGVIASIVYLTSVRPRLRRAGSAGALDKGVPLHTMGEGRGPDVLASDEDRERVTQQLHHHYATGRLTLDDLNQRLDLTLRARTLGDLSAMTKDLPQV
jgi:hypothetical protein